MCFYLFCISFDCLTGSVFSFSVFRDFYELPVIGLCSLFCWDI